MKRNIRRERMPSGVRVYTVADTILSFAVMLYSLFLSIKYLIKFTAGGAEPRTWEHALLWGLGFLLAILVDGAKSLCLVSGSLFSHELSKKNDVYDLNFFEEHRGFLYLFIFGYCVCLAISLAASYSELSAQNYRSTLKSKEYTNNEKQIGQLDKQININQSLIDSYQEKLENTRYHMRQNWAQHKIDSIGVVTGMLQARKDSIKTVGDNILAKGAGEASYLSRSMNLDQGMSNLILGIIIEFIGALLVLFWAFRYNTAIVLWMLKKINDMNSGALQMFMKSSIENKRELLELTKEIAADPANRLDIEKEMEHLDIRVITNAANLLRRGAALPPTLRKKLDVIPEHTDGDYRKLLAEVERLSIINGNGKSKVKTLPKTKVTFENTDIESDKIFENENENSGVENESFQDRLNDQLSKARKVKIENSRAKAKEIFDILKQNPTLRNVEIGKKIGLSGQRVGQIRKQFNI